MPGSALGRAETFDASGVMVAGLPGQPTSGNQPADNPPRLLLIAAEPALVQSVRQALQRDRFEVREVSTADEATTIVWRWLPKLAIVDLELAGGMVLEQLTPMIEWAGRFPAIALTRRDDLQVRLAAFDWGVDDVISVPFWPEEVLARIRVILRRHQTRVSGFAGGRPGGDLDIDISNRKVILRGAEIHLTAEEQGVLYLLIVNAGRTVTWEELLRFAWGADVVADRAFVDRVVRSLRAKLGDDWRHPRYVATVARTGYAFVQPELGHPGPTGPTNPSS
jgi:DNA-binding response OmpR family regulator